MSPDPNVDLQAQIRELQQQRLNDQLDMARLRVYGSHPHLRDTGLLEQFQGTPEQIVAFGDTLAQRIPPPAPTPAPLTQAPGGQVPAVQPAPPAPVQQAPEPSAVLPQPSQQDVMTQQSADVARAADIYDRIRESMQTGRATVTPQDARWFAQFAPAHQVEVTEGHFGDSGGFVHAVKKMGAQRNA